MEYVFTRHARNRMRLYGIERDEVERTLAAPDQETPGSFGRRFAWKARVGQGWLRVAYRPEGARCIVITVTPKRREPGDERAH